MWGNGTTVGFINMSRVKKCIKGWQHHWGGPSQVVVKNPPVNTGDIRDTGSISGSGRSLGVGNGNPLHYPSLENLTEDIGGLQSMWSQRGGHN